MKSIFVSSTFQDMQNERDMIQLDVLPQLRELLAQFGENFNMIDLRWGIDTTELESEEGTRKILSVCLDQIDNCNPYIIVLLGDRYGWIPESTIVQESLTDEAVAEMVADKSITELEIQYGALAKENPHALFYFREPVNLENLPEDLKSVYAPESETHRRKLNALKEKIQKSFPDKIRTYSLEYNPQQDSFEGINELKNQMIEDLTELIKADMGEIQATNWEDSEILEAWRHIEEKGSLFAARGDLTQDLMDELDSQSQNLFIYGDSGVGKSTLLAKLALELKKRGDNVIPIVLSLTESTHYVKDILEILVNELENILKKPEHYQERIVGNLMFDENSLQTASDSEVSITKLKKYCDELINEFQSKFGERLYLIFDGIDQLDPETVPDLFSLIPETLPENVQVVISSNDRNLLPIYINTSKQFLSREITVLNESDIREIIRSTLYRQNKELDDSVIEALALKNGVHSPLYLSLLLNRLLILDNHDFKEIKTLGNDMEAINQYLISIIKKAPESLKGMVGYYLDEVSSRINPEQSFFTLESLARSRSGLREQDLEGSFGYIGKTWNALDFARLQKYLNDYINIKTNGVVDFTHRIFRNSLEERLTDERREELDYLMFTWLGSLPIADVFKAQEFYYYSKLLNEPGGLITYINDIARKESVYIGNYLIDKGGSVLDIDLSSRKNQIAAGLIAQEIHRLESNPEEIWFASIPGRLEQEGFDNDEAFLFNSYVTDVLQNVYSDSLEDLNTLLTILKAFYSEIIKYPDHQDEDFLIMISSFQNAIGIVYNKLDQPENSVKYLNESINNLLKLQNNSGLTLTSQQSLASQYLYRGKILQDLGQNDQAIQDSLEALSHFEIIRLQNPSESSNLLLANSYHQIGNQYLDLSRYEEARDYLNRSLDLFSQLNRLNNTTATLTGMATAYLSLGSLHLWLGENQEAMEHYNQAEKIVNYLYRETGSENTLSELINIINNKAYLNLMIGHFQESIELYERAENIILDELEKTFSFNIMRQLAKVYGFLGNAYRNIRNFDTTLSYYKRAMKISTDLYWNNPVLDNFNSLFSDLIFTGDACVKMDRLEDAENYLSEAEKVVNDFYERYPGLDNSSSIATLNLGLGELAKRRNDLKTAETFFLKSLSLFEKLYKNSSDALSPIDLAETYNQLAQLYLNLGDFKSTDYYGHKAVELSKSLKSDNQFNSFHEALVNTEIILGTSALNQVFLDKSRKHFLSAKELIKQHQKRLGGLTQLDEMNSLTLDYNLALIDYMIGESEISPDRFILYYNQARKFIELNYDYSIALNVAKSAMITAQIYLGNDNLENARKYIGEAIDQFYDLNEVSENNEILHLLINSYNLLGQINLAQENVEDAQTCFEQSLVLLRRIETEDTHNYIESLADTLVYLSKTAMLTGNLQARQKYLNQALNAVKTIDPSECSPSLLISIYDIKVGLGLYYEEIEDFYSARDYFLEALQLFDQVYGTQVSEENFEARADLLDGLAETYYGLNDFNNALMYISQSIYCSDWLFEKRSSFESLANLLDRKVTECAIIADSGKEMIARQNAQDIQAYFNDYPELNNREEFEDIRKFVQEFLNL